MSIPTVTLSCSVALTVPVLSLSTSFGTVVIYQAVTYGTSSVRAGIGPSGNVHADITVSGYVSTEDTDRGSAEGSQVDLSKAEQGTAAEAEVKQGTTSTSNVSGKSL